MSANPVRGRLHGMPTIHNITSSQSGFTASSGTHQFVTPVVREIPRPVPEPRSFSSVW
jgi:hypothetical protein